MSIDIDEMRRIREMMKNFLYAVHGYGVSEFDLVSVKKEQEEMTVHGLFKVRNEEFKFTAKFDNSGNLLTYEREKSGPAKS